jgi:Flp pilus assembly protein TadG
MHLRRTARRGAALVEFAIVAPLTLLLVIGLLVGGLGVFHTQQMAMLAREASRWASVHGTNYAAATGHAAATATDVYDKSIKANAVGLDLSHLTYAVTWNANNGPSHTETVNGKAVKTSNTVTVKVNYNWIPEAYLGGINLSSSSTSVMSY